jgi:hypothetical protein
MFAVHVSGAICTHRQEHRKNHEVSNQETIPASCHILLLKSKRSPQRYFVKQPPVYIFD